MGHVQDVKARIAQILLLNSDPIRSSKTASLRFVSELPCGIVYTGQALDTPHSADQDEVVREYRIDLLYRAVGQDYESVVEDDMDAYYDSIRDLFEARPSLTLNDNDDPLLNLQEARITGDSGLLFISLNDTQYAGIQFTLEVRSIFKRNPGL